MSCPLGHSDRPRAHSLLPFPPTWRNINFLCSFFHHNLIPESSFNALTGGAQLSPLPPVLAEQAQVEGATIGAYKPSFFFFFLKICSSCSPAVLRLCQVIVVPITKRGLGCYQAFTDSSTKLRTRI